MNQSEFESLMMAHDNLQRELSDIKRLMGKDKHALIKNNIALNRKVKELERDKEELYKLNQRASEDATVRYKSLLSHTIEQAERLQELRKRYLTLTKENNQVNDELIDEFRKNKRYREAIDKIKGELYKMSAWGKEEISMLDIIYDLEGEE